MTLAVIPILARRLVRVVYNSLRAESTPVGIDQEAWPIIEVCVSLHIRHSIKPGKSLLEKGLELRIGPSTAVNPEFGDPYR